MLWPCVNECVCVDAIVPYVLTNVGVVVWEPDDIDCRQNASIRTLLLFDEDGPAPVGETVVAPVCRNRDVIIGVECPPASVGIGGVDKVAAVCGNTFAVIR